MCIFILSCIYEYLVWLQECGHSQEAEDCALELYDKLCDYKECEM